MAWLISRALLEAYASSPCSQVQAEASSVGTSLGGELSALLNGKDTLPEFLHADKTTESSNPSPFGMTSKPLTADLGDAVLTWCLADSLAKTSAAPDEVSASAVRVRDYGLTWHVLSAKWNLDMCAWKTAPSLLDEGWTMSLPTLPRWGSMSNGQLWLRRMSGRRINETASGYTLPTPVKYDAHGTWESNNYHGLGWLGKHGYKATDEELLEAGFIEPQMPFWPTPIKSDARISKTTYVLESVERGQAFNQLAREVEKQERIKAGTWPTPKALDYNKRGNFDVNEKRNGLPGAVRRYVRETFPTPVVAIIKGEEFSVESVEAMVAKKGEGNLDLGQAVKRRIRAMVPTPIANDAHGGSDAAGRLGGASLKQTVARAPASAPDDLWQQHPESGELNPQWVEWLQGWPIGWTSMEPLKASAFKDWLEGQDGPVGRARWWDFDPSVVGNIPRTCHKNLPDREDRIAALGNGQVSAVMAAAWIHLSTLEDPPEEA